MKSTDGYEIEKGKPYYLENGTEVYVELSATADDGKRLFKVTPHYEGDTLTVDEHGEMYGRYEHEGEPILVKAVFHDPPLKKLNEEYKGKLKQIEALSLTCGGLKSIMNGYKKDIPELESKCVKAEKDLGLLSQAVREHKIFIIELKDSISEKAKKLQTLEDSTGELEGKSETMAMIRKTELSDLRRRDFKLSGLEAGGVDNWDYYDSSLEDYRKKY